MFELTIHFNIAIFIALCIVLFTFDYTDNYLFAFIIFIAYIVCHHYKLSLSFFIKKKIK